MIYTRYWYSTPEFHFSFFVISLASTEKYIQRSAMWRAFGPGMILIHVVRVRCN